MQPVAWSAVMIGPSVDGHGAARLRTEFRLDEGHGEVATARLHMSAHGVVESYLAGVPVSSDVLTPGFSSFEWRLRYRTYDVASALQSAAHGGDAVVLGLEVGHGWYRGRLGWTNERAVYGDRAGAIAQLEITYVDGHTQRIVTDGSWTAGPSAVLADDLYDGQTIDARLRDGAWLRPGFDDPAWTPADIRTEADLSVLTPYVGPSVVRQEELPPVAVWTSPSGKTLVDFGQNLVGWVKVTTQGEAGSRITVRHAEVIEHSELGARPLRSAAATDTFICSGGDDVFEPTMTFHGFRYVEVSGLEEPITADNLVAVVVSSDLDRIGTFACSDELVNQLHSNVVWSQRGNFLDLPTDCPQRDERLGWTGDIAVFAPTAAYLFDVSAFLRDWLLDLEVETVDGNGTVPLIVPNVLKLLDKKPGWPLDAPTAIWGDAAVWVPWALWEAYGDQEILQQCYSSMALHVRTCAGLVSANGLWDTGFQLGDWLDPTAPPENPFLAKADKYVVATACLFRSAALTAASARVLGLAEDEAEFSGLAERTRTAFNAHYVSGDGLIASDAVTVYAMAIAFGLLDAGTEQRAGDRLAELVTENGFTIATGFAGTPYVTDALTATGHVGEAYRLLLQTENPSWLYPVTMGATTIWERWDSMLPDGTINPGQMTSFNHYALGSVADWLHRTVAGLAPAQPGYRRVRVAPRIGGGLTWARASLRTARGEIAVGWRLVDDELELQVRLPDGVEADVDLPGAPTTLGSGEHLLHLPAPTTSMITAGAFP
ncbi:MAG TPA: family 78 glycoside hydrolase catalytic domain [Microlunatus sp.]|nr:family 78 glycoside hydrolase catalytic domain [Microlunatus sp.]